MEQKRIVTAIAALLAAVLMTGCGASSPFTAVPGDTGGMDMAFSLSTGNVASGVVTVTRDTETRTKTISISGEQGIAKFFDMTPGTWLIDVKLYNSTGELLYTGSGSAAVTAGQTANITISMVPQEGNVRIVIAVPGTPLLWNTLDDGYTLTASDIGPAVVYHGTPVFVPARFETGVEVREGAAYLSTAAWVAGEKSYGIDEYTVEFWFAHTGAVYDSGSLFSVSGGPAVIRTGDAADPSIRLTLPSGSDEHAIPMDGALHHYAVTVSSTECRLYIDGTLTHTVASLPAGEMSGAMSFGDASSGVTGVFDNLKIFRKAKTDLSDRFIE